jgi:hypothetical protein
MLLMSRRLIMLSRKRLPSSSITTPYGVHMGVICLPFGHEIRECGCSSAVVALGRSATDGGLQST